MRKSDFYLSFPAAPGVFSTHTALDRHAHARKRRVMSHAFSESAIKGVEDFVLTHVNSYIQKLAGGSKEWTEPRDVATWSTYFGFDVMGDLSFGKSFGMLEGEVPENRRATFLLCQAAKRHNTVGVDNTNIETLADHHRPVQCRGCINLALTGFFSDS